MRLRLVSRCYNFQSMKTHRRGFLGLAGAMAAAAAPQPVKAAVYGVGHAHARSKIRVLRALPQFDLVGVCPRDLPERFSEIAGPAVSKLSPSQILDDPSIQLVAVEAHVGVNLAFAHEAIDAGKFVHLDKSPGADLASLQDLFRKAKAKKLVVQMGYMWRYHSAMRRAVDMALAGELGRIYMIRTTINKPMSEEARRPLADFKGGMMFEMGGHMIDRIVEVLGPPVRVQGRLFRPCRPNRLRHDGPFDDGLADNTLAVLEFDRAMAEVYVAALQPNGNAYRTFEILGTKGTATVQPFAPDGHLSLDTGTGRKDLRVSVAAPPYETDFMELARVIRSERSPRYNSTHDLAVQRTLLEVCGML